jgi:hypothetical protein
VVEVAENRFVMLVQHTLRVASHMCVIGKGLRGGLGGRATCVGVFLCVLAVCRHSDAGVVVTTLSALDADQDPFVFLLLEAYPSPAPFAVLQGGAVVVTGGLDYEAVSEYVLTVSVNETTSSLNCPSSAVGTVRVLVVDVSEAPVFQAATSAGRLNEGAPPGTWVRPAAWFGSTGPVGNSSGSAPFGYGYFFVEDLAEYNTSLVRVEVVRTEMVLADAATNAVWTLPTVRPVLALVKASGGPCTGGTACELSVVSSSPELDFDSGLRYLRAVVIAVGSTGLNATVVVEVEITPVNEGVSPCARARMR